jgi:hypothetical protein
MGSSKPTHIILTLHGENPMPDYSTFARVKGNTYCSVKFFCMGLQIKIT